MHMHAAMKRVTGDRQGAYGGRDLRHHSSWVLKVFYLYESDSTTKFKHIRTVKTEILEALRRCHR